MGSFPLLIGLISPKRAGKTFLHFFTSKLPLQRRTESSQLCKCLHLLGTPKNVEMTTLLTCEHANKQQRFIGFSEALPWETPQRTEMGSSKIMGGVGSNSEAETNDCCSDHMFCVWNQLKIDYSSWNGLGWAWFACSVLIVPETKTENGSPMVRSFQVGCLVPWQTWQWTFLGEYMHLPPAVHHKEFQFIGGNKFWYDPGLCGSQISLWRASIKHK